MIRVLVVDDHLLFRDGLTGLLGTVDYIDVVGSVGYGQSAVRRALELRPDVVMMEFNLPGLPGLEATRQILANLPDCGVLVLTMLADEASVVASLRVRARGYLLKRPRRMRCSPPSAPSRRAAPSYGPRVAARLLDTDRPRDLTARESEVLALLAGGLASSEIARELGHVGRLHRPKRAANIESRLVDQINAA